MNLNPCRENDSNLLNKHNFLFLCFFLFVTILQPITTFAKGQNIEVNYFYISACSSCHDVEHYLAQVSDRVYPKIKEINEELLIYKHNTAEQENLNLLNKYFAAYKVPDKDQNLPIVFFGKSYISGEKAIKLRLEEELLSAEPGSMVQNTVETGKNTVLNDFNGFKVVSTFFVGFANGLTPCSLSMLLFFISLLLARNVNIIKMGMFYCIGKFMTYFFLGTLLFKTLGSIRTDWLDIVVKSVMLIAIIIFIFLNAMDFLAAKGEKYDKIKLQLPIRLRGLNHKWIKAVSKIDSPAALLGFSLLLGIGTSIGEFLCTGQIYLTTILYVLHGQTGLTAKALLYFLEYNFAFITPLLLITFIIYKGKGIFDVSEFIRRNMHIIKLINIIIFLAIGLFLIFKL
jgi:sulfite exporter TauE/SafE